MRNERDLGRVGTAVSLGLAVGGIAFAAFLSQRHSGGKDDAPLHTRRKPDTDNAVTGRTVTIRKPRAELYNFWHDFEKLPQFMENVESLQQEDNVWVWVIKAPAGQTVQLKTEIIEDTENELIAWQSVEGSDIETNGQVSFTDAPGDRGTRVSLVIFYDPPLGKAGQVIAKLFRREPQVQARHDLKRFKMLMETNEIATSARTRDETRKAKQQENG